MLGLFKKSLEIVAPISGNVIELDQVPDKVFAEKLVGDGAAIDSTGDVIKAPVDGTLTLIFKTNHAFAITTKQGIELLIHIGLDTVELNGDGFERIAEEGTSVKAGDPIIKINRDFISGKGISLITPVLVTNMDIVDSIKLKKRDAVTAGKDSIFSIKLK
ncbi:MAG: putative system, N-acetylglucosamine-specific component [Clostridiaceae bacterium]|jgi:glucose-specific phosphotransferase system IIA component|nr:putative system, N-acetylglucosamine-specific component [Clostridiaceae bacterium]